MKTEIEAVTIFMKEQLYSFVANCRDEIEADKMQILGKKSPLYYFLTLLCENDLKTTLTILRNLDNFPRGTFYSTSLKIWHKSAPLLKTSTKIKTLPKKVLQKLL